MQAENAEADRPDRVEEKRHRWRRYLRETSGRENSWSCPVDGVGRRAAIDDGEITPARREKPDDIAHHGIENFARERVVEVDHERPVGQNKLDRVGFDNLNVAAPL